MSEFDNVENLEKEVEELYKQTYSDEEEAVEDVEEDSDAEEASTNDGASEDEVEATEDNESTESREPQEEAEEAEAEGTREGDTEVLTTDSESATKPDTPTEWELRYRELQAYTTKIAQQNAELLKQFSESKTDSDEKTKVEREQEALEKFTAEYPELAELILPVLDTVVKSKVEPVKGVIEDITEKTLTIEQTEFNKTMQEKVPDVMDILQSQDFAQWMQVDTLLPSNVKAQMFTSPKVTDATSLIGQYKLERKIRDDRIKKKKTNKTAKAAADTNVAVKDKNKSSFAKAKGDPRPKMTVEDIAAMSLEEFAKHEAEIDKYIASGSLII